MSKGKKSDKLSGVRFEYYDIVAEAGVDENFLNTHGRKFGDCVIRACAYANEENYIHTLYELMLIQPSCARNGMIINNYRGYLRKRGWKRVKCNPHLSYNQMPKKGTYIIELKDHLSVIKNGVNYDTEDWRRWKITGYWFKKGK